jgi:type IV fimbrial biogenesis protein FimT
MSNPNFISKQIRFDPTRGGYSLMELMVVITILSIMLMMGMPSIQSQYDEFMLEHAARQFVRHAQFARQYALYSGHDVVLRPRSSKDSQNSPDWSLGWQVESMVRTSNSNSNSNPKSNSDLNLEILAQHSLNHQIQVDSKAFTDPHTGQSQIRFNPAGAARTKHGGFLANRIIMRHTKNHQLERHIILAASGRWRICNPRAKPSQRGLGCSSSVVTL